MVAKLRQLITQDSSSTSADLWEKCWEEGVTPWELGQATPVVLHLLQTGTLPKGRVLVPGCGTGYDVVAMASADRYVLGLDISSSAVRKAKEMNDQESGPPHNNSVADYEEVLNLVDFTAVSIVDNELAIAPRRGKEKLASFDGNSLKVAELLFKGGFKEVYAIKGGLRGKDGWQAIQETLLPPSVQVYPRKKKSKSSAQLEKTRERTDDKNNGNGKVPSSSSIKQEGNQDSDHGRTKPAETSPEAILANGRPLSPYPMYPDLKPPSSPSPSKPQS